MTVLSKEFASNVILSCHAPVGRHRQMKTPLMVSLSNQSGSPFDKFRVSGLFSEQQKRRILATCDRRHLTCESRQAKIEL